MGLLEVITAMTLRYGLIGSGMMGHEHIRNIAPARRRCEVGAVADPDDAMRSQSVETALAMAAVPRFGDHIAGCWRPISATCSMR